MSVRKTLILLALALFWQAPVNAAESIRAFKGASEMDWAGVPAAPLFQPRRWPEREFIESYSLWMQMEDGTTILVSLLISNLGRTGQPGLSLALYPPQGPMAEVGVEYPPAALQTSSHYLQFEGNRLELMPDGRYRLSVDAPLRGGGQFTAEFMLRPTVPAFRRGNGQIVFGSTGRRFELLILAPRAEVEGSWRYRAKTYQGNGLGYLDHASQNLWAHYIATRWFNFRFFSKELLVASTSFVAPSKFNSVPISHTMATNATTVLLVSADPAVAFKQLDEDHTTGYAVPRGASIAIPREKPRFTLDVALPRWLDRQYLLKDLNPLLRAFITTFIARPYTYRYRIPATLKEHRLDGTTKNYAGTMVAELIFVNPS